MARHRNDAQQEMARGLRRIALGALAFIALILFVLWRIDDPRVERLRMRLADGFSPLLESVSLPASQFGRLLGDWRDYSALRADNRELRLEIERLRGWREAAQRLERENAELRALNNLRLAPRIGFAAGEVAADPGGPFGDSVLVKIGARDGVEDGSAAVDGFGLVGRVVGVGDSVARVLLLTDFSSRVPVKVLPSGRRGVLTGDGSPAPLLDFLLDTEGLSVGDEVVTSGDGGVFPPDVKVGALAGLGARAARVTLAAAFRRLEFLRVLRWEPDAPEDAPGALIVPPGLSLAPKPEPAPAEAMR